MTANKQRVNLNICIIGDPSVGKKSLRDRYLDFEEKTLELKNSLLSIKSWYKRIRTINKRCISVMAGTKYDIFQFETKDEYDTHWRNYCRITKKARLFAANLRTGLVYTSAKESVNVRTVFKLCVAKIFELKLKIEQNSFDHSQPLREWNVLDVIDGYVDPKVITCVYGYIRTKIEPFMDANQIIPYSLAPIIAQYAKYAVDNMFIPKRPRDKRKKKKKTSSKRKNKSGTKVKSKKTTRKIRTTTCPTHSNSFFDR
eukprot:302465_1